MKKAYSILLFLGICPVMVWAQGQECLPIRNIPFEQLSFKDGEQITFVANHTWAFRTAVGELTTTVYYREDQREKEPYFEALATVKTYPFFDRFFRIRDSYEARFKVSNLRPLYFFRDINEGKYTIKNRYFFKEDYSIDARITRSNNRVKDTLMQGKSCTFDLMTLLYFARNIETSAMKVGEQLSLSFVIDEEMHDLHFRYLGTEQKRVPGVGTFQCKKFSATLVAGVVFTGKEEMLIWLSDDDNRLPIWLETPIVVGRVSARISKYEGLKFPLTSKIR
ncbi:MAG: DUF3108 domain-containing protein [Bacteroidales bacterium]|nr:DUF3108 domain-containing protein [Bacteroidales bacterium]